jgi:hypothetical protein
MAMVGRSIEDIFKITGVPTVTFVKPSAFAHLKVALRTAGRGVIIEGPSGIGKSTAVTKVLEELDLDNRVSKLSARIPADVDYIEMLPDLGEFGTVVIDDFHTLGSPTKAKIADLLKVTADAADPKRKLIVIGINEAGSALIDAAPDLTNRIDVIRFEVEPQSKVEELVSAGEAAAHLIVGAKGLIVQNARGSFFLAQLLCLEACIQADITEVPEDHVIVTTSYSSVQRKVVGRQKDRFGDAIRSFARGTKFRPSGRAPYLHILRWLAESDSWSISVPDEMRRHPSEKASVGLVLDRGYLLQLTQQPEIAKLLHLSEGKILSVEDPMLVYYLRSINWSEFVAEVGFTKIDYTQEYDVALSFAGEDREYAESLYDALQDQGHTVFYDREEQARSLGVDVEQYLGPFYESGCRYVVVVLGESYGRKRWTIFESSKFKPRIERGEVIPIWSRAVAPSLFDEMGSRGGLDYDPNDDLVRQAKVHAETISKKLVEPS